MTGKHVQQTRNGTVTEMMAQVLSSGLGCPSRPALLRPSKSGHNSKWTVLQQSLRCRGRHSCLFADNRRQEQARKALEGALGEKKTEFEKWNKEIQKREEAGGGGNNGSGGWFGGGGFGWFRDEHFWKETQQTSLAILGIVLVCALVAKGQVMFAVIFNSLLFVLRGSRNGLSIITSRFYGSKVLNDHAGSTSKMEDGHRLSAKERVIRKWGMD